MNPYIILGLLIGWLSSLAGVGLWQRHDGATAERLACEHVQTIQASQAATQIKAAEDAARTSERQHTDALSTIATNYEKDMSHAQAQHVADLAALRAGTLRLRIQYPSHALSAGDSPAGQASAAASGSDGGAPGELPHEVADFLLGLAQSADDVARQLAACQRVIIEDRAER